MVTSMKVFFLLKAVLAMQYCFLANSEPTDNCDYAIQKIMLAWETPEKFYKGK